MTDSPIDFMVADFEEGQDLVEVIYMDTDGRIYTELVHIPRFEDGTVDEEYFDEVLMGQLLGVHSKRKSAVIIFKYPEEITKGSSKEK